MMNVDNALDLHISTNAAEHIVGMVSHDLRTPLTAIRIGVDLLRIAKLDPKLTKLVSRMDEATKRAQGLIEDLLDFSQARMGRLLPVSRRPMNLHSCVHNCLEEVSLVYPGPEFNHVQRGNGNCFADQARLTQALTNLVVNAVTYGDSSRPMRIVSETRGTLSYLSVQNHGQVIRRKLRATIFEPMVRGVETCHASNGLGLGLFIVREIAKGHQGDVSIASTAVGGTTLKIRWNRWNDPDDQMASLQLARPHEFRYE